MEKTLLLKAEPALVERENHLKKELRCFEESNLTEFQEYYRQLLESYRSQHENRINAVEKEYENKYELMKVSLQKKYKDIIDARINLFKEKLNKKSEIISNSLVDNDKSTKKVESLKNQITEKHDELNQKNRQLEFCKKNIKNVLNNFVNLSTLTTRKHNSVTNNILDKQKMFQKYLGLPTEVDLELLNQDDEWPEITI